MSTAKKKPAAKKAAPKKVAAKKAAPKKVAAKKAAPRKPAAKKKTAKAKKAPARKLPRTLRGAALAEAVIAHLKGPKSPIGEPVPLGPEQIARCEEAMGVALSPFMYALFSYDVGWISREVGLFDDDGEIRVSPCYEVIADHADAFAEAYEPWCTARFTGKAAQLDAGSDSMRFLYLGAPDEHGEYPVLGIDHDDLPLLCVEYAGFDLWVASALGLVVARWDEGTKKLSKRLLGSAEAWEMGPSDYPDFDDLPPLATSPVPGSIARTPQAAAPATESKKKMTVTQLAKALRESARAGRMERLDTLLAEAKERGLRGKAIDDALVEACLGKQKEAIRALLAAGASPAARDYYGGALSRLVTYGGDVELVRMLLDAGFSPDSPGVNGETVIFDAIQQGDEAITRLLIARGADVNHRADNELVPLHQAVREQKDPRFVAILCEAGAVVDPCKKQCQPLYWAAEHASLEHVRILLAHGANPGLPSAFEKRTPLHAAYAFGRDDVAALLCQAGADRTLKDTSGLSFEHVYGPDGADARPIAVRFAPSAEPQVLTVSADLAITNRYQAESAAFAALDASHWQNLILSGAAAEGLFPPESSRAEVLAAGDRTGFSSGGRQRISFSLRVSALAPAFVHAMCLSMLGGTRVFTGTGMESALRVAALEVQGSLPGGETLDAAGLRSSAAAPGTWGEPPPFELMSKAGAEAAIVASLQGNAPEGFQEDFRRALQAWVALLQRVPPEVAIEPGKLALMAFPQAEPGKATLVNLLGGMKQGPLSLPWSKAAALAQLGQVMRALHARAPLSRVELVLPE